MTDLLRILVFALLAVVMLSLLKQYGQGYALLFALAVCAVLLSWALELFSPVLEWLLGLIRLSDFENLSCVLKAAAIVLLTQNLRDLCSDAGQQALAGQVDVAGKAAVLITALPLLRTFTVTLQELLR